MLFPYDNTHMNICNKCNNRDNKTLVVTANEFDEFYFNVDAEIIWPRLSNRSNIYSFITTRIGNTDVSISSSSSVMVVYVMIDIYYYYVIRFSVNNRRI